MPGSHLRCQLAIVGDEEAEGELRKVFNDVAWTLVLHPLVENESSICKVKRTSTP